MDKDTKKLLGLISIVVIAFAVFFVIRIPEKAPETITGLVTKTLEGEEDPETNYKYNGFVFIKVGPLWYTKWQRGNKEYNIPLHFGPLHVENISIKGKIDDSFNTEEEIFITFDSLGIDLGHVALSAGELSLNLVRALNKMPVAACLKNETDACSTRPIKNCTNTDKPIIYLKEDPEAKILLKGNCIIVQGNKMDIMRATDRLILQWYGIMQ